MDGSETAVPLTHRHPQGGGSMSEHDAGQAKPFRGGEGGEGMTYADAGVDIRAGEEAVRLIREQVDSCLLYTSDAADDLLCVDLGGRRIIKKKKKKINKIRVQ